MTKKPLIIRSKVGDEYLTYKKKANWQQRKWNYFIIMCIADISCLPVPGITAMLSS